MDQLPLSNDILLNICDLVCLEDAINLEPLSLQQFQLICTQFRNIAIASPRLWSYVDDRMSPERIHLQLARSKGIGMTFRVSYLFRRWDWDCWDTVSLPPSCRCYQWALIKENSERWTTGQITIDIFVLSEDPIDTDIVAEHICSLSSLEALALPQLSLLTLYIRVDHSTLRYNIAWSLPKLSKLVILSGCRIPKRMISQFNAPDLRHVEVVQKTGKHVTADDILQTLDCLVRSLPITSLTVDLSHGFNFPCHTDMRFVHWQEVLLRDVEELDVRLSLSTNHQYMYRFLIKVKVPKIKRIRLRIANPDSFCEHLLLWLNSIVHANVESLEVVLTKSQHFPIVEEVFREELLDSFREYNFFFMLNAPERITRGLPGIIISAEELEEE